MAENTTRPPTPVGWSDTDWIKHLREQKESHPLAGLHINQGSMDAAADAYEAEYYAARRGGRALDVVFLIDPDGNEAMSEGGELFSDQINAAIDAATEEKQ